MLKNKENIFYYLKAFAIFSVICAHITPITENASLISIIISKFYDYFGCLGVGIFFILSGYFFYNNKHSFKEFWKLKLRNISIPWMFIGTIVYVSVFYFNGNLSLINYFLFLLGYGSYLYYLTVLFLLYLLFFHKNAKIEVVGVLLSLISNILTIVFYEKLASFSYINIFNWIIYFMIGMYINQYKLLPRIKEKIKLPYISIIVIILLHLVFDIKLSYFSYFGFITVLLSFLILVSKLYDKKLDNKMVQFIGKNSFSIYLMHMPIAGVVTRICNLFNNGFFLFIRPFITLGITVMIIIIYQKIIKKLKLPSIFYILLGLRKEEK